LRYLIGYFRVDLAEVRTAEGKLYVFVAIDRAFPDGKSALMLVAAGLRYVASTSWGNKRYLQMNRLADVVVIA
jgi:hypothetical protein